MNIIESPEGFYLLDDAGNPFLAAQVEFEKEMSPLEVDREMEQIVARKWTAATLHFLLQFVSHLPDSVRERHLLALGQRGAEFNGRSFPGIMPGYINPHNNLSWWGCATFPAGYRFLYVSPLKST